MADTPQVSRVEVYYDGWGEHWHWGTLLSTRALGGRPALAFEYSAQALAKGLELSAYTLPLRGPRLRRDFPAHQLGLPGPVYDALPDGWGMLLMDRLFQRRGLHPARIGPLERLTYIGAQALGALSFEPVFEAAQAASADVLLSQLAAQVQAVLQGEGGEFLHSLLRMGGSPQGARPKALLYHDPQRNTFSTEDAPGLQAWLVKFPGGQEHPEVCAIEATYAACLRACGIPTPQTAYFALPQGQAAFATQRFDRQGGLRVPMQSLAAFTGADFRLPGTLDYVQFLRATQMCTNDARQKAQAFERAVFNIVFHNRDDHPKNFAYLMSPTGDWTLAPAYDVTFCAGPGGYHQMDVLGEAAAIDRARLRRLGVEEAELSGQEAEAIIDRLCLVASTLATTARRLFPGQIRADTLQAMQALIDENIQRLR